MIVMYNDNSNNNNDDDDDDDQKPKEKYRFDFVFFSNDYFFRQDFPKNDNFFNSVLFSAKLFLSYQRLCGNHV